MFNPIDVFGYSSVYGWCIAFSTKSTKWSYSYNEKLAHISVLCYYQRTSWISLKIKLSKGFSQSSHQPKEMQIVTNIWEYFGISSKGVDNTRYFWFLFIVVLFTRPQLELIENIISIRTEDDVLLSSFKESLITGFCGYNLNQIHPKCIHTAFLLSIENLALCTYSIIFHSLILIKTYKTRIISSC